MYRTMISILILFAWVVQPLSAEAIRPSIVLIQYTGSSDRPFMPVIIGTTQEKMEAFRDQNLREGESAFADLYVRNASVVEALGKVASEHKALNREQAAKNGVIAITLYEGSTIVRLAFDKATSLSILEEIYHQQHQDHEISSMTKDLHNRIVSF